MPRKSIFNAVAVVALLAAPSAFAATGADTGVVVTSFTAGLVDPQSQIPHLNGVPGAGVNNWDIAIPTVVLTVSFTYDYQMTFQSIDYKGKCKGTYKLMQVQGGKKVTLDSGTIAPSFDCSSPSAWVFGANSAKPIPNSPGPATLIGTLATSKGKVTVKVPMLISLSGAPVSH